MNKCTSEFCQKRRFLCLSRCETCVKLCLCTCLNSDISVLSSNLTPRMSLNNRMQIPINSTWLIDMQRGLVVYAATNVALGIKINIIVQYVFPPPTHPLLFHLNEEPIKVMQHFAYLDSMLISMTNVYLPAVFIWKLEPSQKITTTNAAVYLTVYTSTLLKGSEAWSLNPIETIFYNQFSKGKRVDSGQWKKFKIFSNGRQQKPFNSLPIKWQHSRRPLLRASTTLAEKVQKYVHSGFMHLVRVI